MQEFLFVLGHSWRTQLALFLAVFSPISMLVLGEIMIRRVVFTRPLATVTAVIQDALHDRYDKAALTCFVLFVGAVFTAYRRDRKRLLHL